MAAEPTSPRAMSDPRRSHSAVPFTDADTVTLVDQAVESLVLMRSPLELGDAGATISALVSLTAEAQSRLPEAVADARDEGYSWEDIASRLATTVTTTRRRYAAHARWRVPLNLD